jgi:short-subunit dehydrogenase
MTPRLERSPASTTARRTALITGASSGIGAALAEVAAAHNHNVVLVARRTDALRVMADHLERDHGIRALVIGADLSDADASARIREAVVSAGWRVDLLANNAGFNCEGEFLDVSWHDHRRVLRVLFEAPAELIHVFLPGMVERRAGSVLNVSSMAGLLPGTPYDTFYGPSKHALVALTRNLAEEYRNSGVAFMVICPGITESGMTETGIGRELLDRAPRILRGTARSVAEESWRALERGKRLVVPGRANRFALTAARCLPATMVTRALANTMRNARATRRADS